MTKDRLHFEQHIRASVGEGAECEGRELVGTDTCSDGVGVPGVGVDKAPNRR